jgi:PIN domain nuclease of toxin-antitoxin system
VKLLLDTHAFLWWLFDDKDLSRKARAAVADRDNAVMVSAASAFESRPSTGSESCHRHMPSQET